MALDNFDREVGNINPSDLTQETKRVYEAPKKDPEKQDNLRESVDRVADAIGENNKQDASAAKEYVDQIASLRNTLDAQYEEHSKRSSNSPKFDINEATSYLKKMSGDLSDFYQAAISKSTIYVGVTSILEGAKKTLTEAVHDALVLCGLCGIKDMLPSKNIIPAEVLPVGEKGEPEKPPVKTSTTNIADSKKNVGKIFTDWLGDLTAILPMFAKLTLDITNLGPKHLIPSATALNNAREQIRQLIFQTKGFGDSNRGMEEVYRNVGDEAARAGVTTEVYQKLLLKNSERGEQSLRNQEALQSSINDLYTKRGKLDSKQLKEMAKFSKMDNLHVNKIKDVTTASLQTANRLNMNAETVNDVFMDWHRNLGLSAESIQRIGLNMIQISRNTGVTGSKFESVLKIVQEMSKSLQDVGKFSAVGAQDLMETMAVSEKYGTTDLAKKLITGTKDYESYTNLDPTTYKTVNVGLAAAIRNGSGLTQEDIYSGGLSQGKNLKKLYQGLEDVAVKELNSSDLGPRIKTQIAAKRGLIREGVDYSNLTREEQIKVQDVKLDPKNMSEIMRLVDASTRLQLQTNIKQSTGMGIGEAERAFKSIDELGLTYSDQVKKVEKELQSVIEGAKTQGLDLSKSDRYKELQRRKAGLESQKGMTLLSSYLEAKKSGTDISKQVFADDANEQFGAGTVTSFEAVDAKKLFGDVQSNLKKQSSEAKFDIEKYLKDSGFEGGLEGLMRQLASDNVEISSNAMDQLTKAQQALLQAQATGQDKATQRRQKLLEIRTKILTPILDKLIDILILVVDKFYWLIAAIGPLVASFSAFKIGDWFYSLLSGGKSLSGIFGKSIGGVLGKATGPLVIAIGGLTGALEAKEAGRTTAEGVGLGMFTGGAKTGSMFSGMLGIQKGSKGDKAMGVGGAAAYGAMAGAALGALFGPLDIVTIPVAAAIGAVVGALVELVKILTEGTDMIPKFFGGLWDAFAGLFTLDFKRMISGVSVAAGESIKLYLLAFEGYVENIFLNIPIWLLKAFKAVFIELPTWLFGLITNALDYLSKNEYIGEIFKPIKELWDSISSAFGYIAGPVGELIDILVSGFEWVKESVVSFLKPLSKLWQSIDFAGPIAMVLTDTIKSLSWWFGLAIKAALFFPTLLFKAISYLLSCLKPLGEFLGGAFAGLIQGAKDVYDWFAWLYHVIVGGSIVPDLVFGIIKFFAMLPIRIMKGLLNLGLYIASVVWEGIKILPELLVSGITTMAGWASSALSFIWDGLKALPGMLWEGFKAVVGYLWTGLKAYYGFMWKIFTSLPKLLWNGFKTVVGLWWNGLKAVMGLLWTGFTALPGLLWNGFKALVGFLWTTFTALPKLLWAGFKALMGFLWDGIKSIPGRLSAVWDYLKSDEFKKVMVSSVSKIQEAFKDFGVWLLNLIQNVWTEFSNWALAKIGIKAAAKSPEEITKEAELEKQRTAKVNEKLDAQINAATTDKDRDAAKTEKVYFNAQEASAASNKEEELKNKLKEAQAQTAKDNSVTKTDAALFAAFGPLYQMYKRSQYKGNLAVENQFESQAQAANEKKQIDASNMLDSVRTIEDPELRKNNRELLINAARDQYKQSLEKSYELDKKLAAQIEKEKGETFGGYWNNDRENIESELKNAKIDEYKKKNYFKMLEQEQSSDSSTTAIPQSTISPQSKKTEVNEKKVADAAGNMKDMAQEALKPGSIYVHDIHVEGLLKSLLKALFGKSNTLDNKIGYATGLNREKIKFIKSKILDNTTSIDSSELSFGSGMNFDDFGKPFVTESDISPFNSSIDSKLNDSYENRDAEVKYRQSAIEDLNNVFNYLKSAPEIDKASSRLMDYREDTKAIVSPITVTRDTVETDLERKLYGDHASSTLMSPSMAEISNYLLETQAHKLNTMIYYLKSIDAKMSANISKESTKVNSNKPRSIYSSFNELKNIGIEMLNGSWDLSPNHYTPSSITNEGSGGGR